MFKNLEGFLGDQPKSKRDTTGRRIKRPTEDKEEKEREKRQNMWITTSLTGLFEHEHWEIGA